MKASPYTHSLFRSTVHHLPSIPSHRLLCECELEITERENPALSHFISSQRVCARFTFVRHLYNDEKKKKRSLRTTFLVFFFSFPFASVFCLLTYILFSHSHLSPILHLSCVLVLCFCYCISHSSSSTSLSCLFSQNYYYIRSAMSSCKLNTHIESAVVAVAATVQHITYTQANL